MKVHVEIEVAVEVHGTLDTVTGEFTPEEAQISQLGEDKQYCLYSETLWDTTDGWLSNSEVCERWSSDILIAADAFVSRKLYTAGA